MKLFVFLFVAVMGIVNVVEAQTITVNWVAGANATSHKVEKKIGAGAYAAIATVPMSTIQYVDTAVAVGNTYCHRVIATNQFGDAAPSNECCSALMAAESATGVNCVVTVP